MADFFSSRLLRLLTVPYRSRLVNFASRPFYQVADRILGTQFLQDIAEFFILFQTMAPGFVRARRGGDAAAARPPHDVRRRDHAEAAPAHEAEFFIDVLAARRFHLGAVVLNKVLPDVPARRRRRGRPAWRSASSTERRPRPTRWRRARPR